MQSPLRNLGSRVTLIRFRRLGQVMALSVDIRMITKAEVVPWEGRDDLYGVAYETSDGKAGTDPIGTNAEALLLVRTIEAGRQLATDELFPRDIAAS